MTGTAIAISIGMESIRPPLPRLAQVLDGDLPFFALKIALFSLVLLGATLSHLAIAEPNYLACPSLIDGQNVFDPSHVDFANLKKMQIEAFTSRPGEFCPRQNMIRFLNTKNAAPLNCRGLSYADLESLVDAQLTSNRPVRWSDWQEIFVLTDNGFEHLKHGVREYGKFRSELSDLIQDNARFDLDAIKPMSPKAIQVVSANLDSLATRSPLELDATKNALMTVACAQLVSPLEANSCRKALLELIPLVIPSGNRNLELTVVPLWKQILSSTEYDGPIVTVAQKMLRFIKGEETVEANVFDELKTAASNSGFANPERLAIDVLALEGSSGANFPRLLESVGIDYSNDDLKKVNLGDKGLGLTILAATQTPIDFMQRKANQKLFSYPQNILTSCDNGKPYHFWMAAYLSNLLVRKGYSADVAAAATFIYEKIYSAIKSNLSAQQIIKVLRRPPFDPVHEDLRVDLAYGAAGAWFGALIETNSSMKIDVDQILMKLLKSAPENDELSKQDLSGQSLPMLIWSWDALFHPNEAFFNAMEQARKKR